MTDRLLEWLVVTENSTTEFRIVANSDHSKGKKKKRIETGVAMRIFC